MTEVGGGRSSLGTTSSGPLMGKTGEKPLGLVASLNVSTVK